MELILPPVMQSPPVRPHKSRRKEADEISGSKKKVWRKGVQLNCTKSGKAGHNLRICRGEVGGNSRLNKLHVISSLALST